jgi:hypothetical protein
MTGTTRSAVVWLNGREARVARTGTRGRPVVVTIRRGVGEVDPFLLRVVREIGDRERVVILGPGSARLALEREYVSLYRRPERLVDVEPEGAVTSADLMERLSTLAT